MRLRRWYRHGKIRPCERSRRKRGPLPKRVPVMRIEPVRELSAVFGPVLARFRGRRGLTPESFAMAGGTGQRRRSDQHGAQQLSLRCRSPFGLRRYWGKPPGLLLIDVIDAWRADPDQDSLYRSRASDFARPYRLVDRLRQTIRRESRSYAVEPSRRGVQAGTLFSGWTSAPSLHFIHKFIDGRVA